MNRFFVVRGTVKAYVSAAKNESFIKAYVVILLPNMLPNPNI